MPLRAAIYARVSSDNQSTHSIPDQISMCRELIVREGWELAEVYSDAAMSGGSTFRPSYQAMLRAADRREFDVLVSESLDRLTREQDEPARLFKQLTYLDIPIVTILESRVTELHVGLKGTMNALFLKDLAARTHRGLRGRAEAGRSAGGIAFGYRVIRSTDARGEPIRGDRVINEAEAAIVIRIFEMYDTDQSPLAIAKLLNTEGILGPGGRRWRDTTIRGHGPRGTGILRNALYIGRQDWNRMRYVKNPATGKRVSRLRQPHEVITREVPELRIIEQGLWDRVQHRLNAQRAKSGADNPDRPRFWENRRAQHILTNKAFCASCGGPMVNTGKDYLACGVARKQGLCSNKKSLRRAALEALILDALQTRLMEPDITKFFITELTTEWSRRVGAKSESRSARERELVSIDRKLDNLINAIADGMRGQRLQAQMDELEAQRAIVASELSAPKPPALQLPLDLAEIYRERVSELQSVVSRPDHGAEALALLRELIERVEVKPTPDGEGFEIELEGAIAAMIRLGASNAKTRRPVGAGGLESEMFTSSVKVVAGRGFEPLTFRL